MINFGLIKSYTCKEIEIHIENCSDIEAEILFRGLDDESINFDSSLFIIFFQFLLKDKLIYWKSKKSFDFIIFKNLK